MMLKDAVLTYFPHIRFSTLIYKSFQMFKIITHIKLCLMCNPLLVHTEKMSWRISQIILFQFIFLKAALIGAGASVIGVGSDVAGSIRIPAMYNGIFGHKPTPGKQASLYKHYFAPHKIKINLY